MFLVILSPLTHIHTHTHMHACAKKIFLVLALVPHLSVARILASSDMHFSVVYKMSMFSMVDSDRNTHSHLTKNGASIILTTFSNTRDKMLMVFYWWSDSLWLLRQLYRLLSLILLVGGWKVYSRLLSGNNAAVLPSTGSEGFSRGPRGRRECCSTCQTRKGAGFTLGSTGFCWWWMVMVVSHICSFALIVYMITVISDLPGSD